MRALFAILCVLVLLAGLLFGALNPQPVTIDLYAARFDIALGLVLLLTLLLGALLGGVCAALALWLGRRRRLRALPASADEPVVMPIAGRDE